MGLCERCGYDGKEKQCNGNGFGEKVRAVLELIVRFTVKASAKYSCKKSKFELLAILMKAIAESDRYGIGF
jgi:hypothetical protein